MFSAMFGKSDSPKLIQTTQAGPIRVILFIMNRLASVAAEYHNPSCFGYCTISYFVRSLNIFRNDS